MSAQKQLPAAKTPALKQAEKKVVVLPSASLGEAQFQTFPGLHWVPVLCISMSRHSSVTVTCLAGDPFKGRFFSGLCAPVRHFKAFPERLASLLHAPHVLMLSELSSELTWSCALPQAIIHSSSVFFKCFTVYFQPNPRQAAILPGCGVLLPGSAWSCLVPGSSGLFVPRTRCVQGERLVLSRSLVLPLSVMNLVRTAFPAIPSAAQQKLSGGGTGKSRHRALNALVPGGLTACGQGHVPTQGWMMTLPRP